MLLNQERQPGGRARPLYPALLEGCVLDLSHSRRLPLLTAIRVNQDGLAECEPSEER